MTWFQLNILKILSIILLAGAIFPVPYFAYYQIMNWVVAGTAVLTALQAHALNKDWLLWVFVLVAIVFNPLAPLHLRADVWQIADLVAILVFIISMTLVHKQANVAK
jgi:hypothetical protein